MFWMAWPEAPLTMLSIAVTTTIRPSPPLTTRCHSNSTFDISRVGSFPFGQIEQMALLVGIQKEIQDLLGLHHLGECDVDRAKNAPVHGNEVGYKGDGYPLPGQLS